MSRNFGHQEALSAGLMFAGGDAVIMMDGDLQHPPKLIPRLIACWQAGSDVVNTVRLDTENSPLLKKAMSRALLRDFQASYWYGDRGRQCRLSTDVSSDRRCLEQPERAHRFIRGLVPWLGFRQSSVTFQAPARWAGQPKYTFRRSLRLALEGVTAFNLYPLRLVTVCGLIVVVVSSLVGAWTIVSQLLGAQPASGWIDLMNCVAFFGGCQLTSIGVLGEYLGRTLDQVRGRPLYIVRSACGIDSLSQRDGMAVPAPHFSRSNARPGGTALPPVHDGVNSSDS